MGIPEIRPYPLPGAADLPSGSASWTVDPDRAVLLVHDMQKYFVDVFPDGELKSDLINNVAALREHCAELGIPVRYTAQPGSMSPEDRGLLKDLWGPGMAMEPRQRDILDELAPGPGDRVLTKWRYSAFYRTDLAEDMRARGRDQLLICGVYAHVGCLATAIESYSRDIETFLVGDALGDFSAEHHQMALRHGARCCAVVLTVAGVLEQLGRVVVRG